MTVMARTLWSLSLFFFLIGLLYWITAQEPAGVTLLMLCSGAAIVAVLPYHLRRRPGDERVRLVVTRLAGLTHRRSPPSRGRPAPSSCVCSG